MAAKEVRRVLEPEVTCALCLDVFSEPKKLPCDHVFCKHCLEALVKRNVTRAVSCPECRRVVQLPNGRVSDLPTAFHINRLIDAFNQVKDERRTSESASQQTGTIYARTNQVSTPPSGDGSEVWVEIGREELSLADTSTDSMAWQRMRRVQESLRERPQQQHNQRAKTFSQFFSQLKSEVKILVQGVKETIRPGSSKQQQHAQPER